MLARRGPSRSKITALVIALTVIWVIIGVVVYQYFFTQPTTPVAPPGGSAAASPVVNPTSIGSSPLELFQDNRFTDLRVYGEVPVEPKNLGKQNPFERLASP